MAEKNDTKKPRTLKPGDPVRLVTARLERVDAKVEKVHADGRIDLVATVGKEEHHLTTCCNDAEGKTPDTWHHASDAEEVPTAAA